MLLDEHNEYVSALNFADSDKMLVAGYMDGYMLLIDTADVAKYKKIFIDSTVKKPDENLDPGNTVRFFVNPFVKIYHIARYKTATSFADVDEFMTSHSDGTVKTWRVADGHVSELKSYLCKISLIFNCVVFNMPVTCVNSSFDFTKMVASCKDHSSLIWNPAYNQEVQYSLVGHKDIVVY